MVILLKVFIHFVETLKDTVKDNEMVFTKRLFIKLLENCL